jgi:hypothetical protein
MVVGRSELGIGRKVLAHGGEGKDQTKVDATL